MGILESTYFWQALSTLALIWLLWHYKVFHRIGAALDKRGERIAAELDEARRLRGDAEALLREYEVKRANADKEAEAIVTAAREEAERMTREAEERLAAFVARRTKAAEDKIAAAEQQAMIEVRDAAIASAVSASEAVLREQAAGSEGERFMRDGLELIRGRLAS
ncbi:F0F1 ATP synthase subunit B family protein [Salinarimonas ramus]|uniref:ATP synthase subunit b n=1 Tax=Salinarimonas ramus TaxID=690164 RepID=A0A917V4N3_9HYPH|nr:ATP F0F1 synthase subunit B [Salinarimonas ramus]GGK39290.1 ATP synthase subunit b 1 [Salinarimonas ramus]